MQSKMYTFKKEERLCSKKLLEELFHDGSSFLLYPYRVTWKVAALPASFPAQVVISVSKRKFKRAHDRNLIKRRIREAYRLHKSESLYPSLTDHQILIALSYVGKDIANFDFIERKLISAFERLLKVYNEQKGDKAI